MLYFITLIFGLLIGSFLNVCIYRIPGGQSIVFPPSRCFNCGERLKWYHMVPVLSYLFLGGKCSYCKEKIPPVYAVVELTTAVLFTAILYKFGIGLYFFKYIILTAILIIVTFIDMETQIIPDSLIITGLVTGIVFALIDKSYPFEFYILGLFAGGGILLAIVLLSRGGMGGGDVKLAAVTGIFLGWQNVLIALFLSFVSGGITGSALLLAGKKGRKDAVPFGPFLSLGAIAAVLFGRTLASLYMNLFI